MDRLKDLFKTTNCFVAGTLVAVSGGFKQIEDIRCGQRVTAYEEFRSPIEERIDPATHVLVKLTLFDSEDPSASVHVETIQTREWVAQCVDPKTGLVEFDLPELAVRNGRLESIEPCPPIEAGSGRVVLTTFKHLHNSGLLSLRFEGLSEPLVSTPTHWFWNETRRRWMPVGQFEPGDQVLLESGEPRALLGRNNIYQPGYVFNLEVEGVHNYLVTPSRLLVHNAKNGKKGSAGGDGPAKPKRERKPKHELDWEHRASDGSIKTRGHETSGCDTPPGRRLSWDEQAATHTERKVIDKIDGATEPGDIVTMRGQYSPCDQNGRGCQNAMQQAADEWDVSFRYDWPGGKARFDPTGD